jgi:hypothetical protein
MGQKNDGTNIFFGGRIFSTLWHKKFPMLLRQKKGSFVFSLILNVFPLCSNEVPEVPKTFPIAPLIYPIWYAQKFNSHASNLKRWDIGEHFCFYFVTGVERGASIGDCPMCPKTWWWANQYGCFKTRKSCECTHELINMNHTMCVVLTITSPHFQNNYHAMC